MMFRRSLFISIISLILLLQLFMLFTIHRLIYENSELKQAARMCNLGSGYGKSPCECPNACNKSLGGLQSAGSVPQARRKPRHFTPSDLTIVLFKTIAGNGSADKQLEKLKNAFPSSVVLWNGQASDENVGQSLNHALSRITTGYFLLLESHVSLSERAEESIKLLGEALETYPELDFVGGSYLTRRNKLHLSCRRFRLCKWTFSESYEYARSLDDVMVCDGTSSSFMGRTHSFKNKTAGFDETLPGRWVVTDFFLRARTRDVVIGTRPNVMFLVDRFETLYEAWNSRNITQELVPFSVKHKVFIYKDIDGNVIELCSPSSPLSGVGLCIKKNSHELMLANRHWAYNGLYTYPYLLKYLEISLSVVTEYLEQHNVNYVMEGGVTLGALKTRSILPWEAGDVDLDVWGMDMHGLYEFFKPLADDKGYVLRKWPPLNAIHIFCTPKNVGDRSGGLATIFAKKGKAKGPSKQDVIKTKVGNIWINLPRNLVGYLTPKYGADYLQHKLYRQKENINCKIKGHNACLPDFRSLLGGKAGNLIEFYCEV